MKRWIKLGLISGLLALCLTTPVVAQQMGNWRAFEFFNLTGGLNNTNDPTAIAINEASDLQNIVLTNSGGIEKRQGFTSINSSAACGSTAFTGNFMYRQADGDRFLMGLCVNDTILKMDYGGGTSGPDGTWDDITGSLSFAIGQDNLADFATVQDVVIIEDGLSTTPPFVWTGSGNATSLQDDDADAPNASMVEFHKRILWLAGESGAESEVTFSNLDAYQSWTTTDTILVETDDNQIITGLKSALDCLYVFKTESVWRICGADRDNLTLEQMVSGIGAASNSAIELINNRFVFLSDQGNVIVYDGGITVQVLSRKIETTLSSDTINMARLKFARSASFDDGTGDQDFYLSLSLAGSGTHNLILLYDTALQAWTKFSGINANTLATYELGTQERAIIFGNYSGTASRYPVGDNDNGSAIEAFYQSGHLRFDIPTQKTFRDIQLILRQQGNYDITFEFRIDFEGTGTTRTISLSGSGALWDTAIFDADAYADIATQIALEPVDRDGDFILWRIENNNADEPFLLRGLRLWAEPVGRLGGT